MKKTLNIKSALMATIFAAGLSIAVFSCKRESATSTDSVTEADAAELATDAIVPLNGGFVVQVNSSVNVYKTVALNCGVQKDSSITASSVAGAVPSYNYNLKWSYLLNCTGIVPNQLTFNFTGSSTYDGVRMSSSDKSSGGFVLTGLPLTTANYTLSSNYTRIGSQTSKIGRNYSFSSTLTLTSSNIVISKTTQQILSGTGTIAVTGASTSGASFSYGGTITFLGGNKATLLFNSGVTYTIQW
jgi:hypothetical protein